MTAVVTRLRAPTLNKFIIFCGLIAITVFRFAERKYNLFLLRENRKLGAFFPLGRHEVTPGSAGDECADD